MSPSLSICIPTKNRQYYCKHAIDTILKNPQDDFELIIQDNSDEDTLSAFVSNIKDTRLKYFYTKEPMASNDNMSLSIERSSGDYVCMIGDDDTILPGIFEAVSYMKKNSLDSLCPAYLPSYMWPKNTSKTDGTLLVSRKKYINEFQVVDIKLKLTKLFESGVIDYQQYQLPRVYHGVIKREVLNKIYNRVGSYFRGLSPDIYSTVALSSLVSKHLVMNKAISIAGACPQSTTALSSDNEHCGELKDAPHLKYKTNYEWDKLVPRFYSVETIWTESAIKAAKNFGLLDAVSSFNCEKMTVEAYRNNSRIRGIIVRELMIDRRIFYIKWKSLSSGLYFFVKRVINVVFFKSRFKVAGVHDINRAIKLIEKIK